MNHLLNGLNELMLRVGVWMQGASAGMTHTTPKSSPWGDGWSDMSMHSDDLPSTLEGLSDYTYSPIHSDMLGNINYRDEDHQIFGLFDD